MATAADIIRRSLKLLGVLAAGESLRAEDQADCLVELNSLLGTWANERLLVYGARRSTYALSSGLSPHTIGVGGTFNVARPVRIDRAGIIVMDQTVETPIQLLTDAEYAAIAEKDISSPVPTQLWVEWTYPAAKLWLWPVPSAFPTLVLYAWSRITEFASSDTVSLPDGYENALAHALALQIAPMYGVEPSPTLVQNGMDATAGIKRANMQTPLMQMDRALAGIRGNPFVITGGGTDNGGLY